MLWRSSDLKHAQKISIPGCSCSKILEKLSRALHKQGSVHNNVRSRSWGPGLGWLVWLRCDCLHLF